MKVIQTLSERTGEPPLPIFLIRHGDDFPFGRSVQSFQFARIVSLPGDLPRLVHHVIRLAGRAVEGKWASLSPVQRQVLESSRHLHEAMHVRHADPAAVVEPLRLASEALVQAAERNELGGALRALRDHDDYTFTHNTEVAGLMALFCVSVGVKSGDLDTVAQAGLVHDIGKRDTPLQVLHKPTRLSEAEWDVMKGHVTRSVAILDRIGGLDETVVSVAAQHHERLDGSGYPNGLRGAAIHELSLVASICDVFSALTDRRPYKRAMNVEESLSIMADIANDGGLDKAYVHAFATMIRDRGYAGADEDVLLAS